MKKQYLSFSKCMVHLCCIIFMHSVSYAQTGTHLIFDGVDDYVQCGSILPISYTKEAWVNINSTTSLYNNIISGGEFNGRHAFWAPDRILKGGHDGSYGAVSDNVQLLLNTWYHVAITYDAASTTMKLYRDGLLVSTNISVLGYSNGQNVIIGSYDLGNNPTAFFDGSIDEVRIWNRALTVTEINDRKNCELVGNETGLIAYYKFNQGIAGGNNGGVTTLINSSPTLGIDGILNNFALTGTSSNWLSGSPVANFPSIATSNVTQTLTVSGSTNFSTYCTDLITNVTPNGGSPLAGSTDAEVWIENTQPATFVKRHYQVTPDANATNATAAITLYFTQQEFDDFNAINTIKLPTSPTDVSGINRLIIEKYSGTSNDGTGFPSSYTGAVSSIDPIDTDIVWNIMAGRWEVKFNVTGFSGFFVKSFVGVLPINLISFSGISGNRVNYLHWKTGNEIDISHFEIEKSFDGRIFRNVTSVTATGNGAGGKYVYTDNDKEAGKIYYRLRIIENDGKFVYSNIIILDGKEITSSYMYPNPIKNNATLQIKSTSLLNTKAALSDINGKTLLVFNITQKFTFVNMENYQRGIYLLKLQNGEVLKLIKE
jgi:Concanavalin A-like lectin/glucanases superfamily/Secretion system C-terminal sorting domain